MILLPDTSSQTFEFYTMHNSFLQIRIYSKESNWIQDFVQRNRGGKKAIGMWGPYFCAKKYI
jgi:hypothetical protein